MGLLLASFLSGAGCDTMLAPTSPDSNWKSYPSAHFTLLVRPGSFAEANVTTLAAVLDDQYAHTVAALALQYQGRITGFLYNSGADAAMPSDYSGVGYPGNGTFAATCVPPLNDSVLALISHEANHVIQHVALGRPGTSFVSEGLASAVLSERYHHRGKSFLYDWTKRQGQAVPQLGSLIDDTKWKEYSTDAAYYSSGSFLAWLLDEYGPAPLRRIYGARSPEFAARFQEVYGRSLDDAERAWRAFCARSSLP